ncbi:MAG: HAD family hydrolase [Spirochaetaceae bacterium]
MLEESVFIFDFDGTLYQGDPVSRAFLESILQEVGREDLFAPAWTAVHRISTGSHGVRVGQFVSLTDPPGSLARSSAEAYEAYLSSLVSSAEAGSRAHRIGDGWGVVFAVTEPLTKEITTFHRAFSNMRTRLASSSSPLVVDGRLRETLQGLKEAHRLILFSNSAVGPDGEALLRHLGIDDLFDEIRFEAGKPTGMTDRIASILRETGLSPERIVSIGDHPWNDLYPARASGAHTVLVSPYPELDRPEWSYRVSDVPGLITLLSEEWALGAA